MTERERIEPSKEAIEAAIMSLPRNFPMTYAWTETVLKAAYAIDFAQWDQLCIALQEARKSYDKLAARANQLEYLVGSIADLLRRDMTNE